MKFNFERAIANAEKDKEKFIPIELNEGNVQAIFNRCLATTETKKLTAGALFPQSHGYEAGAERIIKFDSEVLLQNAKAIEYLFGQLKKVHDSQTATRITIDDYNLTYRGENWTTDKATMLKFLYLGVTPEALIISPFRKEDSTSIISPRIKPTLSPKDPNFPAWWETHKGEWEQ